MARVAKDFWSSRTTWSAIAGIVSETVTVVLHKPEYVPLIGFVFTLLTVMFARDTTARKHEEVLEITAAVAQAVPLEVGEVAQAAVREIQEQKETP